MNGKRAKQLRKVAPMVQLAVYKDAEASIEKGVDIDATKLPSQREVYRKLKHKYTRKT